MLELNRTVGNQAANRVIQAEGRGQAQGQGQGQVRQQGAKAKGGLKYDPNDPKQGGQAAAPLGAALNSDIGAVFSQAGKSSSFTNASGRTWNGVDTYGADRQGLPGFSEAGAGFSIAGNAVVGAGDLLTIAASGGELHEARKDAEGAKRSGSRFWFTANRRQQKIKGTDVGVAATKFVTSDMGKIAGSGASLAKATGDISSQAASIGGMVTAAAALPVQVLSVLRDFRKLLKQGFRLHRMRKRLYDHGASANVQEALRLKNECDHELLAAQQRVAADNATISELDVYLWRYEALDQLIAQSLSGETEQARAVSAELREANQRRDEAGRQLDEARRELQQHEAEVQQAQAEKAKADEGYKLMATGVTDMAAEVKGLDEGKAPSLKALAYYARVKSAKGVTRRTTKVIAGGLGVAAGIISVIALASGPGALILGPIGIALGAAGAALGLGLASETAWRFLSKR